MYRQKIVIPSYKPSNALLEIVDKLIPLFQEVVVVDDGGGEEYSFIFEECKERGCTVLTHAVNMGKGRALKTAFNYCLSAGETSGVITVDGDGQHKIKDIVLLAEKMDAYPCSLVLGCRKFEKDKVPFKSYWGNTISRVLYKSLCGLNISDTQTGLRGIPQQFLYGLCTCSGERYEYETNMLLLSKELGYSFEEIAIETVYENNNEGSHFNPIKDSIKIYAIVLKYSFSSIISFVIDYSLFAILLKTSGKIIFATYLARTISCIVNFLLNKKVVFHGRGNFAGEFAKYVLLVIISATISGVSVSFLSDAFKGVSPLLIKLPVEAILFCFNFIVQRTIVFSEHGQNLGSK